MKHILKNILPDRLIRLIKSEKSNWKGDFETWGDAEKKCTGYNADIILQKVKDATQKVQSGEAAYERDSVLFDKIEYSWPLLAGLLFASIKSNGRLYVLDFGGSLGSTYFQNKNYLDQLNGVDWNVVEQAEFVKSGREFIRTDVLNFYYSAEECIAEKGLPDFLLFSTTLPYLERPYELLTRMLELRIPFLFIDNTIFNYEPRDRITIQHVPKSIYEASYPCWFLNYNKVSELISQYYHIISEHFNEHIIQLDGKPVRFRGIFGKLKNS